MRTEMITLPRDASVAAAMRAMLEHRVGALSVIEGYRIRGIIPPRDLLGQALYRLVGDIMTTGLATIGPDEPITTAYQIMEARDVNQLPVVEHGRLIGLVTRLDILHELGKLTDPLTGLPWPGTLRQRAAELLQQGQEIVILFIDLERFRLVNKRFGHVVGDRLITAVAAHLLHATDTAQDLLCRYGGDEFAIVTTRGAEQAEALAETILAGIRPLTLPEMEAMEVLQQAIVEEESRLRLGPLSLTVEGDRVTADVELEHEGRRYTGGAEGSAIGHGPLRVLAQATVSALAQMLPPGWGVEGEEITYTSFPLGAAVSVALVLGTPTGEEFLMGTVPFTRNDTGAVVLAVLKAVNRRLGRLLVLAATK